MQVTDTLEEIDNHISQIEYEAERDWIDEITAELYILIRNLREQTAEVTEYQSNQIEIMKKEIQMLKSKKSANFLDFSVYFAIFIVVVGIISIISK